MDAARPYDVLVIGAGPNGLTCAAALARGGRRVAVLERATEIGGVAAAETLGTDYRTAGLLPETGAIPSAIITDLDLAACGLQRTATRPPVLIADASGPGWVLHDDPQRTADELRPHSAADASAYPRFHATIARIAPILRQLLSAPPPDVFAGGLAGLWPLARSAMALRRLGQRDLVELSRVGPMAVADWMTEWFEHDLVRGGLAVAGTRYSGYGPRAAGTALALLLHHAIDGPPCVGGAAAVVAALARCCDRHGVEVHTGAAVARVRVEHGAVAAVDLDDGATLSAPRVVATCDPRRALLDLLPPGAMPHAVREQVRAYRSTGSTAIVHLALRRPLRWNGRGDQDFEFVRCAAHLGDLERSADPQKYGEVPAQPTLAVHVPALSDRSLAPAGHTVATVTVEGIPYARQGGWTADARAALGRTVVDALGRWAPAVSNDLVTMRVLSPVDLEERYGLTGGHLLHGAHDIDQRLIRPVPACARYRTPVRGYYLGGSGSHPGGGVTCTPGWLSAAAVEADG